MQTRGARNGPEQEGAGPALEEIDSFSGGLLLLRGEGEICFLNQAARDTLGSLGVGTPRHVDELPPQLRAAVKASAPSDSEGAPEVRRLTDGLWGVQLPVTDVDPEWLRGMVEAEQLAAVGQMAATVAQEIGGPNTSIQVAVDHLLKGPLGEGEAERTALRQVLDQTARITRLTRQLIALADPGQTRLEPLDVNEIAESACDLMQSSFMAREIVLDSDFAEGPARARADRNHLLQALVNLLLNARTALQGWDGERRVRVRTERNGDRVYLHIEDSGPGIPAEESSRIFLPFVSTTGGTGMGLFLTRQLVVEQRGGIRVQARNDLGGATFTVFLEKATDD